MWGAPPPGGRPFVLGRGASWTYEGHTHLDILIGTSLGWLILLIT
jgi:hypothetical protein